MKKIIIFLMINMSLFNVCHGQLVKNKDLIFFYNEYSISAYNNDINNVNINILINNIGNDTLYISKSNIKIVLRNYNNIINDKNFDVDTNKKHSSHPLIFPSYPPKYKIEEKEKYLIMKDSLINIFSNTLFEKNAKKNQSLTNYKENILKKIKEDCILILPKETYSYNYLFRSSKFDKKSIVDVSYNAKNIFSIVVYDNKVFKIEL